MVVSGLEADGADADAHWSNESVLLNFWALGIQVFCISQHLQESKADSCTLTSLKKSLIEA